MSSICFDPVPFLRLFEKKGFKPGESIIHSEKYFAHTPISKNVVKKETLVSHMGKVEEAFFEIVDLHRLDGIVDNHINRIVLHDDIKEKQKFYEFLKLLFFEAIHFHDIGKLNENYQIEKMEMDATFERQNHSIGSTHSKLSVFLFYAYMFEQLSTFQTDAEKGVAYIFILLFSMPIRKHHSPDLTNPFYYFENSYGEEKNHFFNSIDLRDLHKYLKNLSIDYVPAFHHDIFSGLSLDENYKKPFLRMFLEKIDSFPLYSLIKMNSSLLTIADYIATSRYMWGQELKIIGVIHPELKKRISDAFYSKYTYNADLKNKKKPYDFKELKKRSNKNLNELRFKLAFDVRENLLQNQNYNNNLFFLEAPTGGGKTNLSFMAAAELLEKRPELNKVFYVFPFTTLVTQTQKSLVETFGLDPEDYLELHSKAGYKENPDKDGTYGKERNNYLDYLFINYPFTLLTHIKFFDIIKSHRKQDNYLYHKLANSIVIIDEIQAYSPEHWDKIYYFLKNISGLFNAVFIVMSATLPKVDKLKISGQPVFSEFFRLNQNKHEYYTNANFAQRVEFDFSLLSVSRKNSLDEIMGTLLQQSENYAQQHEGRCWTLIEFIFKNSAAEFYEKIQSEALSKGFEIKMLSGTILEPVRKKIISDLKRRASDDEKTKILLIATQVIEAGVDLDFDLGFKDTSIIDSDEQLAGRINRNAMKTGSKVFLFNYNDEYQIYGSDYRYRMQKQELDVEKHGNILRTKNFDDLYNPTVKFINELNQSESRVGFFDYESLVRNLSFSSVHNEFKLIDQDTLSVFVNVEFDLTQYPIEKTLGLDKEGKLRGEDVFEKYCAIVENKDQDFIDKRISLTEIQALMSNFIFSTYTSRKMRDKLVAFSEDGEEKYGFWYIQNLISISLTPIYTLEGGLNEKEFAEIQFI
jgi:CRISPR-associated endonuclease/helicase Cas3